MRPHSRSIALAVLAILLGQGVAPAQDLLCGKTLRRALEQKYDRVTFSARADEVVSITVAAVADPVQDLNFQPEFQVEAPDGDIVRLAGPDAPRTCESPNQQCETTPLPLDGDYIIIVSDNGKKQTGTYAITLEAVSQTAEGSWNGPPTPSAPDAPFCKRFNDAGKADGTQAIAFDTPVTGVIDDQGETDTFTFVGTTGQTVTGDLSMLPGTASGVFDPRWRLFDPSGQPVGTECSDPSCTRGPFGSEGVYTIKVYDSVYAATGGYALVLRDSDATTTTTTTSTTTTTTPDGGVTTPTTQPESDGGPTYELSRTLRRPPLFTPPEALGASVAASATRLLIGVPDDQTGGPEQTRRGLPLGAAYLMSVVGAPPQPSYGELLQSFYKPDGSSEGDRFGAAVALLDDDTAAVGAPGGDVRDVPAQGGTVFGAGAVYLFPPDGSNVQVITAPRPTTADDPPVATGDEFGATLAAQGGELFIGAPGQAGTGLAYLVSGGKFTQRFNPRDAGSPDPPRAGDRFGAAIAAAGDLLAIGAPADSAHPGRVYLYDRRNGLWRVLRSPTPEGGDEFGAAVAFVDSTLVIGAPGVAKVFRVQSVDPPVVEFGPSGFARLGDALAPVPGGVLVGAPKAGDLEGGVVLQLDLEGSVLAMYRKLAPEVDDGYGTALAAAADGRVFIGAPRDDAGNPDGGAVYAYSAGTTVEEAIFRKRVVAAEFGSSAAADDTKIVVGAPGDAGIGAVYAFDAQPPCPGGVCTPLRAFPGLTGEPSRFGQAVALADGDALIGAPDERVSGADDVGAAYLAALEAGRVRIGNPDSHAMAGDQFGFAVTSIENDLLVGAPLLGSTDTGAVFVFDERTRQRRLTLRNPVPTTGDFFGAAIAAEGDGVAVGAPFDGTAAPKAGAVYLFRRASGELLEGKPLVSPEPRARELFGAAVAISADVIVVGAPSDDVGQPGRAYVFERQSRGLVRILENPNRTGAGDRFGAAVAIVDGLVLVGAPRTDVSGVADTGAAYLFDLERRPPSTFDNPESGEGDKFGSVVASAPWGFLITAPRPGRTFVYRRAASDGLAVRNALAVTAAGPRCGDGIRQDGEQCDDGNAIDTDSCTNDCRIACCIIDPQPEARCNDFDPCTDDALDPVSGQCVNTDNGRCCTSDASCAGQNDVCRVCAGCSLFAWDCCGSGSACLLSSPECQGLSCFEKATCECQGGLTCSEEGATPRAGMSDGFREACDLLRQEEAPGFSESPVADARAFAKRSRKALRAARRETRRAYRQGAISKTCRKDYLNTIRLVRKSIPHGGRLNACARAKNEG
jgi:cysteine-rich repeat protein